MLAISIGALALAGVFMGGKVTRIHGTDPSPVLDFPPLGPKKILEIEQKLARDMEKKPGLINAYKSYQAAQARFQALQATILELRPEIERRVTHELDPASNPELQALAEREQELLLSQRQHYLEIESSLKEFTRLSKARADELLAQSSLK
ncbi:hypothetical protein WDW37_02950 [Bdellovibrionota bacterium FG-1]